MRRKLVTTAVAIAALALGACGGPDEDEAGGGQSAAAPSRTCDQVDLSKPAGEPVTIRLGHGRASEEPLWLMEAMPELTEHDGKLYDIDFRGFRGTGERLTAFQAGDLDAAIFAPQALIRGVARGAFDAAPVVTVIREAEPGAFSTTFSAKKGGQVTDVQGLAGQTIGIVDLGSHIDYLAKKAVSEGGAQPSEARYVVVPFPTMADSITGGRIAVGALPEPFHTLALQSGQIQDVFTAADVTESPFDLLMVGFDRKFIQDNVEAVCAFREDYQRSLSFYEDNREQARKAIVENTKFVELPLPIYLKTEDYGQPENGRFDPDSMQQLMDEMIELGVLKEDERIDVRKLAIPGVTAGS